jgi:adenylosuccinate synthase
MRVGDTLKEDFRDIFEATIDLHLKRLDTMDATPDATAFVDMVGEWLDAVDFLRSFDIIDSEHYINKALKAGKKVLCEGAQGTMLDVDFGSYPFVTSSNTISAGACTGLGVAPNTIGDVYGIFKAYCTRVGSGPFPTELFDATGNEIRKIGHEYGAVTGRERRCGWIDLVALRYAIMINGVTRLIMMKSDVLDSFDTIKVCNSYMVDGVETVDFPYSIDDTDKVKPVYTELPGWKSDLTKAKSEDEFPAAFKDYIAYLEKQLEVPITIVSVGPDRTQTIELNK